ncbi:MAG TPA: hypothetical protein VN046_05255 [Stenotrophobium sp.]|nr:hypothetical protein [Stenotrophobium sp.]
MSNASLKLKVDKLNTFIKGVNALTRRDVLVGIPEDKANRDDDGNHVGEANNAMLGYIHDNGSPAANIPARPFMRPGIKAVQDKLETRLKSAANAALDGNTEKIETQLEAAGLLASVSIKKAISDGDFAPLAPSTIAARARGRQTKSQREAEQEYAAMTAQGVPAELAQAAAGIKPLVNTGQLRNSITYVVRGK